MYCKKCGAENINEAKFCRNCGAELIQIAQEPVKEPAPVKKKKKKLWGVISIIMILAAIAGSGYFAMKYIEEKRIEKKAEDYKEYMTQADKYLEKLDYKKAEDLYLSAIEIDPKQKEPYLKLADVYVSQEEYEKAEDILQQAKEVIGEDDSEINEKQEEIEQGGEYTWVVNPTVEADDIYYVPETDYYEYTDNDLSKQFQSPYAVIKKGNALGVIDMDGKLKAELEYKDIHKFGGLGYLLKRITPKYSNILQQDWDLYWLDQFGNLLEAEGLGGGLGGGEYYWYNGLHCVWENNSVMKEYLSIPKSAIPVKQSDEIFDETQASDNWWEDLKSPYAVCKDKKLVTDFQYDECGSCSEGLLAVCRNGKWGYINENGENVIPEEYDPTWMEFGSYDYSQNADGEWISKPYCYAASYGYVNLRKGNKWELRDIKGNLVIRPGVFETILPVYDGKCWVRKDGKWGVIQIGDKEEETQEVYTDEDIKELLLDYFNNQRENDGTYVIFDEETMAEGEKLTFAVRYQLSEKEADEITATGGTPSANKLVTGVSVDRKTGNATDDFGESWNLW